MKISEITKEELTGLNKQLINRVLFSGIEDDSRTGDIIFVFGGSAAKKYRVPLAVELYKHRRARKILMSGGQNEVPEAVIMAEKAVELGVPIEDIILETKSTNTIENVKQSKLMLNELFGLNNINRILVVTTLYHMRRCHLTLKTYMPKHIEYSLCPALDNSTRPNNWWESEKGKQRVTKEIEGLIHYTSTGKIMDLLV